MTLVHWNTRWVSSAGMPIISQMMSSGIGAATASTKSHCRSGCSSIMRSTIAAALTLTYCSTRVTSFGVKPFDTIERRRKCRGSSMLIIDPKNSFISCGRSGMFDPCPERNSCGLRLAVHTSS